MLNDPQLRTTDVRRLKVTSSCFFLKENLVHVTLQKAQARTCQENRLSYVGRHTWHSARRKPLPGTERKFRKLYLGRHRCALKAFISAPELIGETLGWISDRGGDGGGGRGHDTCCPCCSSILLRGGSFRGGGAVWELLAVVVPHQYSGDSKNSGTGGRAPFSEAAVLPDLLTPGL